MSALLDSLLDAERRAQCAQHDAAAAAGLQTVDTESQRIEPVPGSACQWVRWTGIPFRTSDAPRRRRVDPPRPSHFGDLNHA